MRDPRRPEQVLRLATSPPVPARDRAPARRPPMTEGEVPVPTLVRAAWHRLVQRHAADVWAWALEAGLVETEAARVSEVVWLRLAQVHPGLEPLQETLREPQLVATWLRRAVAVEADRERRRRTVPNQRSAITPEVLFGSDPREQ